jgi:hypothetical protein
MRFERFDRFERKYEDRLHCSFIGTTAAIITGALAAGSSIAGGVLANKGANAQANAVKDSSAAAIAEQQRQYDLNRQDLAPWRNNGGAANNKLAYLLGIGPQSPSASNGTQSLANSGNTQSFGGRDIAQYGGGRDSRFARNAEGRPTVDGMPVMYDSASSPQQAASTQFVQPDGTSTSDYGSLLKDFSTADFQADPGYNFRLGEGAKSLERSAAANGTLFSGGTLKSLDQYNQNFASNEFGNAYNRFNTNKLNRYNMLAGLSAGGQQAANNTVQAGTNAANNISNITVNAGEQMGNARASGYAGIGQAVNNGVGGLLNLYYAHKTGN